MAAQREIEQRRESMASREVEIGKLVEAVEAKKKLLSDRASDVGALKESIAKDGEAARARMAELEAKIGELRGERNKLATAVKPDVLKRYSAIRMRRGLAVVAVKNGTCQGCNMNIPPQLYIILQRGVSIETCPSCSRIIYWEEIMKDDPAAAGAPGAGFCRSSIAARISPIPLPCFERSSASLARPGLRGQFGSFFTQVAIEPMLQPHSQLRSFIACNAVVF